MRNVRMGKIEKTMQKKDGSPDGGRRGPRVFSKNEGGADTRAQRESEMSVAIQLGEVAACGAPVRLGTSISEFVVRERGPRIETR
jgi:hypothetical protein